MVEQEKNVFKRAFIRVWYNDNFRMFVLVLPTHGIITIPSAVFFLHLCGISNEFIDGMSQGLISFIVLTPIVLAFIFNDYTNLNRIGRHTSGKLINK